MKNRSPGTLTPFGAGLVALVGLLAFAGLLALLGLAGCAGAGGETRPAADAEQLDQAGYIRPGPTDGAADSYIRHPDSAAAGDTPAPANDRASANMDAGALPDASEAAAETPGDRPPANLGPCDGAPGSACGAAGGTCRQPAGICCGGCWNGTACVPGDRQEACGLRGQTCQACPSFSLCCPIPANPCYWDGSPSRPMHCPG